MKTSKFTDEQIAFALRQAETGTTVAEVVPPAIMTNYYGKFIKIIHEKAIAKKRHNRRSPDWDQFHIIDGGHTGFHPSSWQ